MSISDLHRTPSPVTVLAEAVAAVRDLDVTWWTNRTDAELVAAVELVQAAKAALPRWRRVRSPRPMSGTWRRRPWPMGRPVTG